MAYRQEHLDAVDMELHGSQLIRSGIGQPVQLRMDYNVPQYEGTPVQTFYEKCLVPSNVYYLAGVLLEYEQYKWTGFALHRAKSDPPYSKDELHFLGQISIHIRRSLQIYRQLTQVRMHNTQLYLLLDQLMVGVLLLNENQQIRYANTQAKELISRYNVLSIDHQGHLKTGIVQQAKLKHTIQNTLLYLEQQISLDQCGGVIELYNENDEKKLVLTITPLSMLHFSQAVSMDQAGIAIFITDPQAKHRLLVDLLRQMYDLSVREIQICEIFINYPNLQQAADQCGLALSSVRTYMKDIYTKTNVSSQSELFQLLMGLTDRFEHIHK